jgi:hypothetical protein
MTIEGKSGKGKEGNCIAKKEKASDETRQGERSSYVSIPEARPHVISQGRYLSKKPDQYQRATVRSTRTQDEPSGQYMQTWRTVMERPRSIEV